MLCTQGALTCSVGPRSYALAPVDAGGTPVVRRKRRDKQRKASTEFPAPTEVTLEAEKTIPHVPVPAASTKLPKGAIGRIKIGQSFAEYDSALSDLSIYVHTPALSSAQDPESGKVFFVGRRGTGKTAIRKYCDQNGGQTRVIVPEIFSPSSTLQEKGLLANTRQRPFRSLVSAFRRALQVEILSMWHQRHPAHFELPSDIAGELESFAEMDFDLRCLHFISRISGALADGDDEKWLIENKVAKNIAESMKVLGSGGLATHTLLIDSIDDYWEGSDEGLIYLTAFMHACLETSTQIPWARTILFVRENIFERVRARDMESSRLETAVVGMEWNDRQLLEVVERRLNRGLTAKFGLGGSTWNAFFEDPEDSWGSVLEYCQKRPRDILIYTSNAVEAAQNSGHEKITIDDVRQARRRFSDNRFRDLGDEYAENYPKISLVLSRFYGLGNAYTFGGIESFIRKLHNDAEVVRLCGSWLHDNASPEKFIRLLYNIGFVGIRANGKLPKFRALGPQDTSPPPVSDTTDVVIHRCYWDALDLQESLVRDLPVDKEFGRIGIIEDLPNGFDESEYADSIDLVMSSLKELPLGPEGATDFEEIVGDVIKLCFFRALGNVEEKSRSQGGRVIRDWIAANRAQIGFWESIRVKYGAVQVIWECKNYDNLSADDFHQLSYYMSDVGGRFVVLAFRGEMKPAYFGHLDRIVTNNNGFVLPLNEKDLMIFLRQARNGKVKEDHIQERYDNIVRKLS
ncbi:P-loop ATPase, Sll1717 family [Streptomyces sp. NPDC020898]|uniref:P-loop ATPase, Sll1717 family n=1 Tax=Streptomyces sp. NPDC020898 TaxID=3365101 RepID=UPI00379F9FE4